MNGYKEPGWNMAADRFGESAREDPCCTSFCGKAHIAPAAAEGPARRRNEPCLFCFGPHLRHRAVVTKCWTVHSKEPPFAQ